MVLPWECLVVVRLYMTLLYVQSDLLSQALTKIPTGNLGTAILGGILNAMAGESEHLSEPGEDQPARLPSRFIACVTRPESSQRISNILGKDAERVERIIKDNIKCVQQSDVVILGCKPYLFQTILGAEGMREALSGKLLISILAGVPAEQLEEFLYPASEKWENKCTIVRAMPNTAASVGESMTIIANKTPPLPEDSMKLVDWIFGRVGKVVHQNPNLIDASTALCGSGPAFCALMLEALADGGVAMGIPRADAQRMAAQTMRGTTGMVLAGEHPAILRDKVSSPGGCTIGGLLVLEEKGVRGAVSRAVREATVVASQLGKGIQGVNGTRW